MLLSVLGCKRYSKTCFLRADAWRYCGLITASHAAWHDTDLGEEHSKLVRGISHQLTALLDGTDSSDGKDKYGVTMVLGMRMMMAAMMAMITITSRS